MTPVTLFVLSALVVAGLTESIVEAIIESAPIEPVRQWLAERSELAGGLFACGKCIAFWISGAVTIGVVYATGAISQMPDWSCVGVWFIGWRLSSAWHDALSFIRLAAEAARARTGV
jgi:hypothetical protein